MSNVSMLHSPAAVLLQGSERHYIFKDLNVIGRNGNSFICLENPLISRKHCVIEKCEESFTIKDLSSCGTFLNGKKLAKNQVYKLQHDDQICLANVDHYTYTFKINKNIKLKSGELSSKLSEKILNCENSFSDSMKKINSKLTKIKTIQTDLREKMNDKLKEREKAYKTKRVSMSSLLTETNEQKEQAFKKLCEMEASHEFEKRKLIEELESKITDISKKEEELQQEKNQMELNYQKERRELEERCQAEINELKGKLVKFELEQERLQVETRKAELKLEKTKEILLDCELEQNRLYAEKQEVELKLESKIMDLTKESTNKDQVVKELKGRLQEQEKAAEKIKKEIEVLEEELQCSICAELFIEPSVLNCGHMFCKDCINQWNKKKKICPMCRTIIKTNVRIFAVDTIIEKNVSLLSDEAKSRRDALIIQRRNIVEKRKGKKRKHKYCSRHSLIEDPEPSNSTRPIVDMYSPPPTDAISVEPVDEDLRRDFLLSWRPGRFRNEVGRNLPVPEPWANPNGEQPIIDLTNPNNSSTAVMNTIEPVDLSVLLDPDMISALVPRNTTIDLTTP